MRIGIISSSGGHLYQLIMISKAWAKFDKFWVSFRTADVSSLLKDEKMYFAYYPESRNLASFLKNFCLAISVLKREKPKAIISCGAGIAPPFFLVAKIIGIYTIYIEPIDFIQKPSLTGVISQYLVDLFLVQHPSQKKFFRRKVHYWGSTLDL